MTTDDARLLERAQEILDRCTKNVELLPNPLQIGFGEGRVSITIFSTKSGTHGIILKDSGEPHEVGSIVPDPADPEHMPVPGEVYLHFANAESVDVLIESLVTVRERLRGATTLP